MQYKEVYQWGCSQLDEAGIEESRLDARLLLEYVCGTDRNTLLAYGNTSVGEKEWDSYKQFIAKRKNYVPLQYITGTQEFMGLEFLVNQHVLIPRQDTECLVEEVMRFQQDGDRILDMCTGSGCILLSLLHYSNYCKGTGVDISSDALMVAKENGRKLSKLSRPVKWNQETIKWIESDLFAGLEEEKFDIVVSNPPYIATDILGKLMEEVRDYEPVLALDGKEDGLFFYRRIIEESRKYLVRYGRLFFEIGYDQAKAVTSLMEEAGFEEIAVVKDLAGLDRVVHGVVP